MTEPPEMSHTGGHFDDMAAAAEVVLTLENAGLPLLVTYPDGRVAMANRAFRGLLGYGLDDDMNRPVWELHADPDRGQRCFHQLLETGHAWDHYLVYRGRDGQAVATRSSAVVTKDSLGTAGLVIVHSLPA